MSPRHHLDKRAILTHHSDIALLEHKVEDLEAKLRKLSVSSTVTDDSQTQDVGSRGRIPSWTGLTQVDSTVSTASSNQDSLVSMCSIPSPGLPEYLVDTLYLDPKEKIPQETSVYRGRTTGVEIVQSLRDLCETFIGSSKRSDHPTTKIVDALDHQAPFENLPMVSVADSFLFLGPTVGKWIDLAFNESFVTWPFIDRESLDTFVKRLSNREISEQDGCDNDHIGLLHAIIALGQRHDPSLVTLDGKRSQSVETRGSVLSTRWLNDFSC